MKKTDLFKVNLVYFIVVCLFVVIRVLSSANVFDFLGQIGSYILSVIIQLGLMFMLPLFLISKFRKNTMGKTLEICSFKKISLKEVFIAVGIGIVIFILNIILSTILSFIFNLVGYNPNTMSGVSVEPTILNLILSLIMTALLPAVCEEFLHRGILLSGYKVLGFKKAVVFSGLLFGLLHLNIGQFGFAFLVGMLLAVVTLFSKSIFPAMIIHFLNNGISVYLEYSLAKGLPVGNFYAGLSNFLFGGNLIISIITIVLVVSILIFVLVLLLRTLLKINAQKSVNNFINIMALNEMRRETLGDLATEEDNKFGEFAKGFSPQNLFSNKRIEIPYEVLGFYMQPVAKATKLDNLFFYSTIILGGLITLFTFIWGII